AGPGWMKAFVVLCSEEGVTDSRHGFVACNHTLDDGCAAGPGILCCSERRRYHGYAWMQHGCAMVVVHLHRMPSRSVHKGCHQWTRPVRTANDSACLPTTHPLRNVSNDPARFGSGSG